MAATYNNLYLDARKRLREAGVEGAQLEARELVCCAAGKSREQFYRDMALYASDPVEEKLAELLERRLAGEPVAYLIGEWEFYGLGLDITPDVLIPRMDTEVLAERAILLARAAGEGARVLDLCAGSGCVGLAVAANVPGCRGVLADVSEAARRGPVGFRRDRLQPALYPHRGHRGAGRERAGLRAPLHPGRRGRRTGLLPGHRRPVGGRPAAGRSPAV